MDTPDRNTIIASVNASISDCRGFNLTATEADLAEIREHILENLDMVFDQIGRQSLQEGARLISAANGIKGDGVVYAITATLNDAISDSLTAEEGSTP